MCSLDAVTVKISPLAFTGALRNLVINAATHAGGALVSVTAKAETALVTIEDEAPAFPNKICRACSNHFFVPIRHGENIFRGGSARHRQGDHRTSGGALAIENRKPRGLRQTLSFERQLAISPAAASPMRAYS
jgi:hypothetical protein